jgi:hypothetical protein
MKKGADIKAGAQTKGKAETTGAGVESKSEMQADVKADSKADTKANADKTKPSTTGQAADQKTAPASKSSAEEKSSPAKSNAETPAAKSGANEKAAPAANSAAQGAQTSASVNLTADQKAKIRTTVIQSSSAPKVSKSQINFNISVGTAVPRSVHFVAVPQTLIEIHPARRGYSYFIVDDEIIIVDSRTLQIVAILAV